MADHPDALCSREEAAEKATAVRQELKVWEKEFAAANGGRKAGRDDIKQNPHIAQKYKEYGQLKNLEAKLNRHANRQAEAKLPESQSKKRKHASPSGPANAPPNSTTPRKSSKGLFATPRHSRSEMTHPSNLDPYDSPSTFRKLFSPSTHAQNMPAPSPLKAAIGPTPQRDGKTLGLFDLLSESGGSNNATPSVNRQKDALAAGFQTPSKPKTFDPIKEAPEEEEEESSRITRTPASSTKQFYLANLFATPTTMRYAAMVEADDEKEVQASANQKSNAHSPETNHSATPSFLRRSNSGRYPAPSNKDGSGLSPIKSRQPGRFHGKGLSTIVQGLRDMEEERLDAEEGQMDDDWELMRELEGEADGFSYPVPEAHPPQDAQRPYKKKGQKRTTRRVIMRPVIRQAKPRQASNAAPQAEEESDDELAADVVPETLVQAHSDEIPQDVLDADEEGDEVASLHNMSEPDPDSDGDPEYGEQTKPVPKPKSFSDRLKEAVSKVKPTSKEPAPVPVKSAPATEEKKPKERKVNPQTHANYRSLKIHRGSRGGGRFRRK
ncbi:hypothetical protein N7509_004846 [Penicillium cosmopolitanum]|uniref:DNA replication regulator SLD2 n=1 Tax=Penicillium cosmopolitanum TaxID=1131564 RepID=A0A9W9W1B3_9EURO|nr:uncharacterized protein N7509_004846 [Penicillium cosmopolitanum]KAJ5396733.1 hypothetical protein N7509_004846 [Penicillium cosmopolitanum]